MNIIQKIMDKFRYNIDIFKINYPLEFQDFCRGEITDVRTRQINAILLENFENQFDIFISSTTDRVCIRITNQYQMIGFLANVYFTYDPQHDKFKDSFYWSDGFLDKKYAIELTNLVKVLNLIQVTDEYDNLISLKMPWIDSTKEELDVFP